MGKAVRIWKSVNREKDRDKDGIEYGRRNRIKMWIHKIKTQPLCCYIFLLFALH